MLRGTVSELAWELRSYSDLEWVKERELKSYPDLERVKERELRSYFDLEWVKAFAFDQAQEKVSNFALLTEGLMKVLAKAQE